MRTWGRGSAAIEDVGTAMRDFLCPRAGRTVSRLLAAQASVAAACAGSLLASDVTGGSLAAVAFEGLSALLGLTCALAGFALRVQHRHAAALASVVSLLAGACAATVGAAHGAAIAVPGRDVPEWLAAGFQLALAAAALRVAAKAGSADLKDVLMAQP